MQFFRKILGYFSTRAARPKRVDFASLSPSEKKAYLKAQAKVFSKKYGSVIRDLAKE